jgi:hypothetical protein
MFGDPKNQERPTIDRVAFMRFPMSWHRDSSPPGQFGEELLKPLY